MCRRTLGLVSYASRARHPDPISLSALLHINSRHSRKMIRHTVMAEHRDTVFTTSIPYGTFLEVASPRARTVMRRMMGDPDVHATTAPALWSLVKDHLMSHFNRKTGTTTYNFVYGSNECQTCTWIQRAQPNGEEAGDPEEETKEVKITMERSEQTVESQTAEKEYFPKITARSSDIVVSHVAPLKPKIHTELYTGHRPRSGFYR